MNTSMIYSNISEDFKYALGYINWYDSTMPIVVTDMYIKKDKTQVPTFIEYLKKKNFHFAARIRKQYHVCIPRDIIYMKLKHFIKEQLDIREEKLHPKPVQLEFDFMKEFK